MSDRIQKKELIARLAVRMETNERTAATWVEAVLETLYEAFKAGESVTLPGLGGFYVGPERNSTAFKFNPSQKLRRLFGWSSKYKGKL